MHELVHTSLPKGLFGGTGYSVAAATRDMPESLRLALQGISNLEDTTPGITWSAQVVNASGGPWLVLSRQQPAAADHTGRSNYIAHHVALSFTTDARVDPAGILKNHPWITTWSGEPRWLPAPTIPTSLPQSTRAENWKRLGFDPGWAGHLAADHTSPVPILYPASVADPLPLVLDALCLLPVADRWQVAFNTRARAFTRAPGWWWARVDSPQGSLFNRQPALVNLTTPSTAPGDHPLIWQARGKESPHRFAVHRPSSPSRIPVRPARSTGVDEEEPALPTDKPKPWLLIAACTLAGLLLGLIPAGLLAWQASRQAGILANEKSGVDQQLVALQKKLEENQGLQNNQDKDCQTRLDKLKADHTKELQTVRNEAEQAFERARTLNTLLEWNTTTEDLAKSLKDKAALDEPGAKRILDSKLVTRLKAAPPQARELTSPADFIGLQKGQPITLTDSLQTSLANAVDVAKKPALLEQALTDPKVDPKAGPRLVQLDAKDIPTLRKSLAKNRKPLSETLEALEKSAGNDPVQIDATPGEWRLWINNERTIAQGERFPGELAWKSLLSKNLSDAVWVNVGQVRKMFASIRGLTGPKGQKMEAKVTTPSNLLKGVTNLLRDDEGRQQSLALLLADKTQREKTINALTQLDTRFDNALDVFVNEIPPQPAWLLHDEIRLAREQLQVLDKAIPKAANLPPEDREKLAQLTRKLYKRLGELGDHNLDNWLKDAKKDPKSP